ncbi:hypothetical protein MIND_01163000 [Mycena indigotica]|uniref:Uncharacterized protein n=1 Tax=Mycena indigotica TaxID=2126181 RepID=A0A8H6S5L4_9AGAR|nr:uncharacterized protein MIND_01163000 [Mycena indigotica]KAF7292650.1 hypothetical protein MIND_01163000 [Mycena indigotica]
MWLLPLVFIPAVIAQSHPLFERQSNGGCGSACADVDQAVLAANSKLSEMCTTGIVDGYAQCYNCMISNGVMTKEGAQAILDNYVRACTSAGFSLRPTTLDGSRAASSSSSGSTSGSSSSGSAANSSSSTGSIQRAGALRLGVSLAATAGIPAGGAPLVLV